MKIKIFSVAVLLALGVTVIFSAFKPMKSTAVDRAWFECIDPSHPELASSYQYLDGQSPSCEGSTDVCAVFADIANPSAPDANKVPVELSVNGNGQSLEDLSNDSQDFTEPTSNVIMFD